MEKPESDSDNPPKRALSPTPEGPEGPFYITKQPLRSDIREDREGLPFLIKFNILNCNNDGKPVPNAEIHAWHADANEKHQIRGEGHVEPTDDSSFLRGIQPADSNGSAVFQTIFPGWYGSRTPHIHFKVFVGGKNCYTGEVYFEDSLTDEIIAKGITPYCERDASNKKTNDVDPVFRENDGFKTVVIPEGDVTTSLSGSLDVIIRA